MSFYCAYVILNKLYKYAASLKDTVSKFKFKVFKQVDSPSSQVSFKLYFLTTT